MAKIRGRAQSFVPKEPLEVPIVESYSAADRNDCLKGKKDPSQTSAHQLQGRLTEKHLLAVEGRKRVCHLRLVRQTVGVLGNLVSVARIGGVLARRECRGGILRIAMETAEAFPLRSDGREFILLFCRPAPQSFYGHLGWARVLSAVWVEQVQGDVLLPLVSMVKCLGAEQWPEGEVHLRSRLW
jgi:hypothetical protein